MPLELRIKAALIVGMASAIIWGASWLQFISIALDHGYTVARLHRQLWLHANLTIMLNDMFDAGVAAGFYPVRVMRAVLAPYYPKEQL